MVQLWHFRLLRRIACANIKYISTECVKASIFYLCNANTITQHVNKGLGENISMNESLYEKQLCYQKNAHFIFLWACVNNTYVNSVEHIIAPVFKNGRLWCHVLASLKPALSGGWLTEGPAVWQSGHTAPFWSGSPLWQDTGSVKHGWQRLPVCGRRVTLGEVLFWGGHSVSACGGD